MQVHVQLFSILRDCLTPDAAALSSSGGMATISLPERATLADLVGHLRIDRYLGYKASTDFQSQLAGDGVGPVRAGDPFREEPSVLQRGA